MVHLPYTHSPLAVHTAALLPHDHHCSSKQLIEKVLTNDLFSAYRLSGKSSERLMQPLRVCLGTFRIGCYALCEPGGEAGARRGGYCVVCCELYRRPCPTHRPSHTLLVGGSVAYTEDCRVELREQGDACPVWPGDGLRRSVPCCLLRGCRPPPSGITRAIEATRYVIIRPQLASGRQRRR